MSLSYSAGLRRRVLRALEESPRKRSEIAAQFRISLGTLYDWQKQSKEEGRTKAKPHARRTTSRFNASLLQELATEGGDRTIKELQAAYNERTGEAFSYSTVRAWILKLGLPWKRNGPRRPTA